MQCVRTSQDSLNISFQCPYTFFRKNKVMRIKHFDFEYYKASKRDLTRLYYSNSFRLKELFWQFNHLLVGSDNILYIKVQNKEDKQVDLHSYLKSLVYLELLDNMGHLAYVKTMELIRKKSVADRWMIT